jgi:hypothetical protein
MNEDLSKDPRPLMEDDDVCIIAAGADRKSLQVIVENDVNFPNYLGRPITPIWCAVKFWLTRRL